MLRGCSKNLPNESTNHRVDQWSSTLIAASSGATMHTQSWKFVTYWLILSTPVSIIRYTGKRSWEALYFFVIPSTYTSRSMCLLKQWLLFHALFVHGYAGRKISRINEHRGYTRMCTQTPSKICNPRYESAKISQRVLLESWQSVGITSTVNRASLFLCFVLLSSFLVVVVVVCLMAGRFTEH